MNILFVGAHHDDLELSIGGSIKRWSSEGHNCHSIILTNSEWKTPDGVVMCPAVESIRQCERAAAILGYTPHNFALCDDFDLRYDDSIVTKVLEVMKQESIDTLITIWPFDAHPTHRAASQIALAASRKIPRILLTKISWNSVPQPYKPNYFVDITNQVGTKLKALQCYKQEYERNGDSWEKYVMSHATLSGLEGGCDLAESFEVVRYAYQT